jgi:hypothetical protein
VADNDNDENNGNDSGNDNDVNTMLLRVLLKKVGSDPYPSATMMDTIEEILTPEATPVYARLLLERIERDEFPSIDMIDRVRQLTDR